MNTFMTVELAKMISSVAHGETVPESLKQLDIQKVALQRVNEGADPWKTFEMAVNYGPAGLDPHIFQQKDLYADE